MLAEADSVELLLLSGLPELGEAPLTLESLFAALPSDLLALTAGFLPEFLKSVSYQPVPFNLNAAAVTCFFKAGAAQLGQSISLGSLIFCRASI